MSPYGRTRKPLKDLTMTNVTDLLNTASFWALYLSRPGAARRRALRAHFASNPNGRLPVNNKWQASSHDPDLARLLKQGVLLQLRDGGGRQHPQNRRSFKRQTYLQLAASH